MKITKHVSRDWCHLCGKRQQPMADVWYPTNAEAALHIPAGASDEQCLRICAACAIAVLRSMVDSGDEMRLGEGQ